MELKFLRKRGAKAFIALVLLALALTLLSSQLKPVGQKAASKPVVAEIAVAAPTSFSLQVAGAPVALERKVEAGKQLFADTIVLRNGGSKPVELTAVYAVPSKAKVPASSAQFAETNSFNARFLSQDPVIRAFDSSLKPAETAASTFSYSGSFDAGTPPIAFIASPPLAQADESELLPVLRAISGFSLDQQASAALGKAFSELLTSPLSREQRFSRALALADAFGELRFAGAGAAAASQVFASLLSEPLSLEKRIENALVFHSLLRRANELPQAGGASLSPALPQISQLALDVSQPAASRFEAANDKLLSLEAAAGVNPSQALLKSREIILPPPAGAGEATSSPDAYDPYELFPTHPEKLSFTVSELNPRVSLDSILKSRVFVGPPLARFEGPAADFLRFEVVSPGKETSVSTGVDLREVVLDGEGKIPFTQLKGKLVTRFFSLPEKSGEVEVEINVEHEPLQELLEEYGVEFSDAEKTLGQALESIESAAECNPVGTKIYSLIPSPSVVVEPLASSASTASLSCPVGGRITSGFGPRRKPCSTCSSYHTGLDIGASSGTSVRAPLAGTIVREIHDRTCGTGLRISHGVDRQGRSFETGYCHFSSLRVRAGQRVSKGDVIGLVGSTGSATGPHLHWIVYANGKKVDPAPYYRSCAASLGERKRVSLQEAIQENEFTQVLEVLDDKHCVTNRFYGFEELPSIQQPVPQQPRRLALRKQAGGLHQNIVYTRFGCSSDAGGMASGVHSLDSRFPYYAALPHAAAVTRECRRSKGARGCYFVEVTNPANGASLRMPVLDVGPWNIRDAYPWTGARPKAESGRDEFKHTTNKAGIDLSCKAVETLGLPGGKGIAHWRFVS